MISRKLFFLTLAILFSWVDLHSQPIEDNGHNKPDWRFVQVAMLDTTNRYFLNRNDSLKSIGVGYKDKQPYIVLLNLKESNRTSKHFDLALEGDRYLLAKKYGTIRYLTAEQIDRIPWPESGEATNLAGTKFDGDSVFCSGVVILSNRRPFDPDGGLWPPARYQGDLNTLAATIAERLAKEGKGVAFDSALVFEGKVTKQFQLKDLTLVLGEKSFFSEVAADVLLEKEAGAGSEPPRAGWFPAMIDRGAIEAKIRIFVKLEQDGTVMIETPRRLRSLTGD